MTNLCYICQSNMTPCAQLVQPCKCKTSVVHVHCLQKWILSRGKRSHPTRCEVCQEPYWGNTYVLFVVLIGVWLFQVLLELYRSIQLYIVSIFKYTSDITQRFIDYNNCDNIYYKYSLLH